MHFFNFKAPIQNILATTATFIAMLASVEARPAELSDARYATTAKDLNQIGVGFVRGAFNCVVEYVDGRRVAALSCGGDSESQICCDASEYSTSPSSCILNCECERTVEEEVTTTVTDSENETVITGVPVLYQFDAKPRRGMQPVGCAGVAATELFLWYAAWGWTEFATDYTTANDQIDWQKMTMDAATTMGTWIRNNASPALPGNIGPGLEEMIADAGYTGHVDHETVYDNEGETTSAFERIKSSIQQGRPVVIGFDSDADEGIGSRGDDWGFIDHYALIVGFDDTVEPKRIIVNMGWGKGTGNDRFDWDIGRGRIHLWFVSLVASEKTTQRGGSIVEYCPGDDYQTVFTPTDTVEDGVDRSISVTAKNSSLPLISTLITGTSCSVRGGVVSHEETTSRERLQTKMYECTNRYSHYDEPIELPSDNDDLNRNGL